MAATTTTTTIITVSSLLPFQDASAARVCFYIDRQHLGSRPSLTSIAESSKGSSKSRVPALEPLGTDRCCSPLF